jgi:hypothetical protein
MIQGAAFRVLACFYYRDEMSFVELCETAGYPTDLGGYYIRQLTQAGYIERAERGKYLVLPKGKQQLAFKYGKSMFAPKPRFAVLVIAQQKNQLVLIRRKAQPFIGSAEWLAGEVLMGESILSAANRVTETRLGCSGQPRFIGFFRRTDIYKDTVFDDKLFAVHSALIPDKADIHKTNVIGEITICSETELSKVSKPSKSLIDIFNYSRSTNGSQIEEHTYPITAADLSV